VRILTVPRGPAGLELDPVLERLWAEGIRAALCEGGAQLGASLLAADHVQRLYLFLAPRLFGERGVLAFPGRFPPQVAEGWEFVRTVPCGRDLLAVLDRYRPDDVPDGDGGPVPPDAAGWVGWRGGVSGTC
jgi:diaminohydroxyphosphoribosylaminopyrimidine deaminase/5-amino-6-(5-phosphoribosylamino)uracil reductase